MSGGGGLVEGLGVDLRLPDRRTALATAKYVTPPPGERFSDSMG